MSLQNRTNLYNSQTSEYASCFGFTDQDFNRINVTNKLDTTQHLSSLPPTPSPPVENNEEINKLLSQIELLKAQKNELQEKLSSQQNNNKVNNIIQEDNKQKNNKNIELSKDVEDQLVQLQEFLTCPSCDKFGYSRNQVLIPCGHLICESCGSKHTQCPVCSKSITQKQKLLVYFN